MAVVKPTYIFNIYSENKHIETVEVSINLPIFDSKKLKMIEQNVDNFITKSQIQSFESVMSRVDSIPDENLEFLLKCISLGYDTRKFENQYESMYSNTLISLLKLDSMGVDISPFISGHYSEIGLIKLDLNSIIRMEYQGNHKYVEYVSNYDLSENVIIDIVQSLYYGLDIVDVNKYVEFHNNPNKHYDYTRVRIYERLEEVSGEHYPLELNPQSYDNLVLKIIQEGRPGICKYFLNKSEHDMFGFNYNTTYEMVMFYINHPEYGDVLLKYLEKYNNNLMVMLNISIIVSKCIDPEVVANMKNVDEFNQYIDQYCDLHRIFLHLYLNTFIGGIPIMIYEYVMTGELGFSPPSHLLESMIDENDDLETFCEKADNLIGKVVDSINTLVKRLVKSFDDLMRKNKTEKTIKELEKLPKNMRLEADIDLKDAADTYSDLLEGYQDAVRNPDKASRLSDKVKKAKEKRKKLVKKVAIGTTVGAVIAYLSLLVRKNNQKEYMLTANKYDAANKIYPYGKKMRLTPDDRKEMDQIYKNYSTAREAIQESEYFRLKLYSSITKSIKSVSRNIKGTFKYGLKDVGEQLTRTGSYSDTPISAHQDGLKYLDLFYGQ